jgi:hypothetical protein
VCNTGNVPASNCLCLERAADQGPPPLRQACSTPTHCTPQGCPHHGPCSAPGCSGGCRCIIDTARGGRAYLSLIIPACSWCHVQAVPAEASEAAPAVAAHVQQSSCRWLAARSQRPGRVGCSHGGSSGSHRTRVEGSSAPWPAGRRCRHWQACQVWCKPCPPDLSGLLCTQCAAGRCMGQACTGLHVLPPLAGHCPVGGPFWLKGNT